MNAPEAGLALSSENSGVPHLPAEDLIVPDQRLLVSEQLGSLQAGCPDRGQPYAETLQSLYNEIPSAEWLFPEGLGPAATEGARRLVIGSIDTVRAHMTADEQTAGSLQLRSGWELPYDFWGTDPLKRLESLRLAYWMVGQLRDNPDIAAVQVMSGHGYAKWRFVDTSGRLPSCAVLHVRPLGSKQYDQKYEYGKPGYGAEATEAITVDTGTLAAWFRDGKQAGLPEMTRQRGGNTQVTIRCDREAGNPLDPNRRADEANGRRVQDIGSILNKSGRADPGTLLAAGNPDTLNHTPVFPAEEGEAEVFANRSRELITRVTERGISLADLQKMHRRTRRAEQKPAHGFAAFAVGDNPYEVPAVRALAHAAGVELGAAPADAEIQQLFDVFGREAVFRANVERFTAAAGGLSQAALARMVERTGVLSPIPLRTIYGRSPLQAVPNAFLLPGTVGWTDKRVRALIALRESGTRIGRVLGGATGRPLDSPTELADPEVVALQRKLNVLTPTDTDYMREVAMPRLASAGIAAGELVTLPYKIELPDGTSYRHTAGDLTRAIASAHPEIVDGPVLHALNQPAGYAAIGTLAALCEVLPGFSAEQFYMVSTGNRVARTADELRLGLYQNTYTAPSSIVRWVQALHRLNAQYA